MRAWILLLLVVWPAAAAPAADRPPCAACVVLRISPGQALALPPDLAGLEILVDTTPPDAAGVAAALADIAARGGRAGLFIPEIPEQQTDADLARRAAHVILDVSGASGRDPDTVAFLLKTRLTEVRGAGGRALELGIAGPAGIVGALLARGVGSYVDVVVIAGADADPGAAAAAGRETRGLRTWRMPGSGAPPIAGIADALRATRGEAAERWLWRLPAEVDGAARIAGELARAARWLTPGLLAPSTVEVRCGTEAAETFLDPSTLETIALARGCAPGAPIVAVPAEPGIERIDLSSGDALIRVPAAGASGRFASDVEVRGARQLTVEEVIARHQAAAARQAALVRSLISAGTLTLTFEAPAFPAPITISSRTTIYDGDGRVELAQREIRVNGLAFGGGAPRLPIIEPERVASPPLAITLTDVYRYRLEGFETIDGIRCHVVAFEPAGAGASLFRGRAWIAAGSFAIVKVAAVQTGLRGAIVSSEQVDEFREQREGVWLLARSDVRQMYEGAAHRTPIHRVLVMASHEINPPDFTARVQAAYASDAVMLRDTPEGFRYLRRDGGGQGSRAGAPALVEPLVTGRSDRVRTLAAGVIIDPNISRPLPFAGLSYVDFDLLGTGAQVNAFFGGTFGQLALSVPSLGGTRWQLAGRAFGIASSYNDRAFSGGREMYDQNIRQRPAHASVWLLRPLTPRISLRAGYDLDYTRFTAADVTAEAFVVPADQLVHGARLAIEGQRGGWQGSLWWNPARRAGWRAWGMAGSGVYEPRHRDFQRYGASLGRSLVFTPRLAGRVELAWMAGRDLDRFSRYSFGTFDNRLRGYPSALVRYDRGGLARGALAWSAARFLRIDGFLDSAAVRDPGFGARVRNYTGVGAAAEAPAPFGLLVTAEWGYGFRGVKTGGGEGTHVIRVSAFKIF